MMNFAGKNRTAKRDAAIVSANLDRRGMRNAASQLRANTFDQDLVGHKLWRDRAAQFSERAACSVGHILHRGIGGAPGSGPGAIDSVSHHRSPPRATIGIKVVHERRTDSGAGEKCDWF